MAERLAEIRESHRREASGAKKMNRKAERRTWRGKQPTAFRGRIKIDGMPTCFAIVNKANVM
jgi:hypothetical protein